LKADFEYRGKNCGEYTLELINSFVEQARQKGLTEIYLLEHTHQFSDFKEMYQPVADYNEYQEKLQEILEV
jgi:N-acetylglutamate synthase-like GNAT family acetyltransferase